MKFRSTVLRAATTAALALLLASCGGESLVAFVPDRVLVFGDQASVITLEPVASQGKKYTVNALNPPVGNAVPTFNCVGNPLWIQVLASSYGFGFPECPGPTPAGTTPSSRILAKPGATAGGTGEDDFAQQVTRQLALPAADGGGIGSNDLVSVLVGVNDVVAAYKDFLAGTSEAEVRAQAEQVGQTLATQVNRIAAAGGKVIMATVPDVSLTPYGRAQGPAGIALLSELTGRVNARLLVNINNNGRLIGLIELNPYLINVVAFPSSFGYVNVSGAACKDLPLPPNCTTSTLEKNPDGTPAGSFTWLWSNALQLSPGGHLQLGSLATTRARNQPF